MKKIIFSFLLILVSFSSRNYAADTLSTDYPFLRNIHFKCTVIHQPKTNIYVFIYSATNDITNRGEICKIEIDISKSVQSETLDTVGLRFARPYIEREFRDDFHDFGDKVIPVSAAKLLNKSWDAAITERLTISISTIQFVKPGDTLSEIELTSKGLPGVRRLTVKPWFDETEFFPGIDDSMQIPWNFEKEDSIRNTVNYYGWTIGPTAPPINFVATVWCDTLLSYTRQSVQLGWLKTTRDDDCDEDEQPNDGIARNIEKRIEKAKKELMKGDSVKARKELEKLVKKVERIYKKSEEAERKKHEREITMTSEAYALLKYNTEYLIERLPEKNRKKGGKE